MLSHIDIIALFRRETTKAKIEITNLPTDNNGLTNHICLAWNIFSDIPDIPIARYEGLITFCYIYI
jgi:hypothetical protein